MNESNRIPKNAMYTNNTRQSEITGRSILTTRGNVRNTTKNNVIIISNNSVVSSRQEEDAETKSK